MCAGLHGGSAGVHCHPVAACEHGGGLLGDGVAAADPHHTHAQPPRTERQGKHQHIVTTNKITSYGLFCIK